MHIVTCSAASAGPLPGVRHLRLDAPDGDALAAAATAAVVLNSRAGPAYRGPRTGRHWPSALLRAAER
ncbi:hypothetical protein [Streptomyces sp. NPDC012510]|uniref:hypothetical protein n=1 Tax=Streptomyces sp. NPDC012510 TaxID=3364838 RepID=UPI0036E5D81C